MPPPAAGPRMAPAAPITSAAGPALFELPAPAQWQAIDFISDLHLSDALPRTFEAFAQHLRHSSTDAIIILGDLFDAWVGDDMRSRDFEAACVDVLAEVATRRQLAVMVGNRDFMLGGAWLRACGAMGLPDPTVLVAWSQRVLLTHGDELCLSDLPYQAFRREVRSAAWQAQFLARPLAERLDIAAGMRRASTERRRYDGAADADIDTAETVRWMHQLGSAEMVHGHTHRPGSNVLAPGYKRHVLSDWDLDSGDRAEVLRLSRDGFERRAPTRAPLAG